jgi:2-polyprenyl-6-methoxyphenol hydroxylase-like FAD-dependent oxidoreductase
MTIEDAAVLAEELSLDPGLTNGERIAAALSAYEGRRRPRTTTIVNTSKKLSSIYNWKNPLASGLRTGFMWLTPDLVHRKQFRAEVERDL